MKMKVWSNEHLISTVSTFKHENTIYILVLVNSRVWAVPQSIDSL